MTRKTVSLALMLLFAFFANAQKNIWVAFYNQENLFDTIDDPHKNDNEFLPGSKNQWTSERYKTKIEHMAQVVASMNDGAGADIIGMCEVENDAVLNDLTQNHQVQKMKYKFVHFEGPDERSIDNALLYQSKKFTLVSATAYPVVFAENLNSKTRDILLVTLKHTKTKSNLIVLVNHFPSRLGGEKESEPKRINAAKILRSIYDSISKADPNTPVMMVGDFNDYPTNTSIHDTLAAKGHTAELSNNDLFNAMYELEEQKIGSHYYKNEWHVLDQIIMSNNMVNCTGKICYSPKSVSIYKQPWMLESTGKYAGSPLRTYGGQKYLGGYSDHLPVYVILDLKK
jgi:predicted extracellular nuclease